MSGPKIDFAELERRKQEELERQRREQLRLATEQHRLRLELDALFAKCQKAKAENKITGKDLSGMKLQVAAHRPHVAAALQVLELADQTLSRLTGSLNGQIHLDTAPSEEGNQRLRQVLRDADGQLEMSQRKTQADVRGHMLEIRQFEARKQQVEALTSVTFQHGETITLVPLTLSGSGDHAKAQEDQTHRYETLRPHIQSALDHSAYLFIQDRQDFFASLEHLNRAIAASDASQTETTLDWMATNVAALDRRAQHNLGLFAKYQSLWAQAAQLRGSPPDPCPGFGAFASQQALEDACAQLDREADKLHQADYIRRQVEKVMTEFGYNMLAPVVLYDGVDIQRQDTRARHFISLSGDAHRAMHVRISNEGHLMMQVASAAPSAAQALESGQPMLSTARDPRTVNAAVADQRAFCQDHPAFLARLKELGINTRVSFHNPVDEKFAVCLHDASKPAEISAQQEEKRRYTHLKERALDA